jgi:hypothetical protein
MSVLCVRKNAKLSVVDVDEMKVVLIDWDLSSNGRRYWLNEEWIMCEKYAKLSVVDVDEKKIKLSERALSSNVRTEYVLHFTEWVGRAIGGGGIRARSGPNWSEISCLWTVSMCALFERALCVDWLLLLSICEDRLIFVTIGWWMSVCLIVVWKKQGTIEWMKRITWRQCGEFIQYALTFVAEKGPERERFETITVFNTRPFKTKCRMELLQQ